MDRELLNNDSGPVAIGGIISTELSWLEADNHHPQLSETVGCVSVMARDINVNAAKFPHISDGDGLVLVDPSNWIIVKFDACYAYYNIRENKSYVFSGCRWLELHIKDFG